MKEIIIPEGSLVMTIGPAASGKSTFLAKHFKPTEIVSSDVCRGIVCDDMTSQDYNRQAFQLFHDIIDKRISIGRTTVADATNLEVKARAQLREIADKHKVPVYALVFDRSLDTCMAQNAMRERQVPEHIILRHYHRMSDVLTTIPSERFARIVKITPELAETVKVVLPGGVNTITGTGFDIIGDVHGCAEEFSDLIAELGYYVNVYSGMIMHPEDRTIVLVGDLTDRGPDSVRVLRMLKTLLASGHHAVLGNHDSKLARALKGNKVQRTNGLAETMEQIEAHMSPAGQEEIRSMLNGLPYQLILQVPGQPDVVVTHAGIPAGMVGRNTEKTRAHCLYGEVVAQSADGPVRGTEYVETWPMGDDKPLLVHGHTPSRSPYPNPIMNVINVDQGVVFGGALTAYQWPEDKLVHEPAKRIYAEPKDSTVTRLPREAVEV
jgi:protein phosphatase